MEGHIDPGRHFLPSAAITSGSDSILSNAVGLLKEVNDSRGAVGFSFTDLAADRTDTRFGEVTTRSVESDRWVQQRLAAGAREDDIFPKARDLPENLSATEFQRLYGKIGSPKYNRIAEKIRRRVAACPLYRG
ncbi:MAG TPA: hypothetical protein ENK50_09435, partial [Sedimenticola sp.]|nr:hypothetical protein [Sedimenticola sp.]